jgi:hypothetical protein
VDLADLGRLIVQICFGRRIENLQQDMPIVPALLGLQEGQLLPTVSGFFSLPHNAYQYHNGRVADDHAGDYD